MESRALLWREKSFTVAGLHDNSKEEEEEGTAINAETALVLDFMCQDESGRRIEPAAPRFFTRKNLALLLGVLAILFLLISCLLFGILRFKEDFEKHTVIIFIAPNVLI